MPTYSFLCKKCDHEFDVFFKTFNVDFSAVKCETCGRVGCQKQFTTPMISIGADKPDRYERKETDHKKKVKDPDRARRMRKKMFGTEGISITKSPYYHKEKRVKAQGTSQTVDKKEFVKNAARNPNALKAAVDVINKKK